MIPGEETYFFRLLLGVTHDSLVLRCSAGAGAAVWQRKRQCGGRGQRRCQTRHGRKETGWFRRVQAAGRRWRQEAGRPRWPRWSGRIQEARWRWWPRWTGWIQEAGRRWREEAGRREEAGCREEGHLIELASRERE